MKNQDKCLGCGKSSFNGYYANGYCDFCNRQKEQRKIDEFIENLMEEDRLEKMVEEINYWKRFNERLRNKFDLDEEAVDE